MNLTKRPLVRELIPYAKKQKYRTMHRKIAEQIVMIEEDKKKKKSKKKSTDRDSVWSDSGDLNWNTIHGLLTRIVGEYLGVSLGRLVDDEVYRQLGNRGPKDDWRRCRGITAMMPENETRRIYEQREYERQRQQRQRRAVELQNNFVQDENMIPTVNDHTRYWP